MLTALYLGAGLCHIGKACRPQLLTKLPINMAAAARRSCCAPACRAWPAAPIAAVQLRCSLLDFGCSLSAQCLQHCAKGTKRLLSLVRCTLLLQLQYVACMRTCRDMQRCCCRKLPKPQQMLFCFRVLCCQCSRQLLSQQFVPGIAARSKHCQILILQSSSYVSGSSWA